MILIDIDMPSCCNECPLYEDRYDYPTCYVTQESRGYNFKIHEKRMPECPLREQTTAGRIVRPESLGFDIIGDSPMSKIKAPYMPIAKNKNELQ